MTGAIEFLQKIKLICDSRGCTGAKGDCPAYKLCHTSTGEITDEADLVCKVMAYQPQEGE